MINGKNVFDQPIKSGRRTYDNIRKMTVQEEDYSTCCLLHYVYFQSYYKMIAIDLNKQQALDADQKQYNYLTLMEIQIEQGTQKCFSLLKK